MKLRLLKFSDSAFLQVKTENVVKTARNKQNYFLKVVKLHHSYWFLSCLNFTERTHQDIRNIPTGNIKGITQDHWFCRQPQNVKCLTEEKIAGSLQESEACKHRMMYFVQTQEERLM